MRILLYKRTHHGDPDSNGCFGVYDCMGGVRGREFDAVIGIGGIGAEAQENEIAAKINWIGIGPHKTPKRGKRSSEWRGPLVRFDHFRDFGTDGPQLRDVAPALARRMYSKKVRHLIDGMRESELLEAMQLLELAEDAPPSPGLTVRRERSRQLGQCLIKRRTRRCSRPATRLTFQRDITPPSA